MAKLRHFRRVVKEYDALADFRVVYIEEAHPTNRWAFRNNAYVMKDHAHQEDRIQAARQLSSADPGCDILVDNMNNDANFLYGGVPERLYIVLNSRIVYAGARGPRGYNVQEVEDWLEAYKTSQQQKH